METPPQRRNDLDERLFALSLRIIRLYQRPAKHSSLGRILGRQMLRSGTAIGANYQEGQAGQSRKDFINKTAIALKEARETHYWLRLVVGSDLLASRLICDLANESEQIRKSLARL